MSLYIIIFFSFPTLHHFLFHVYKTCCCLEDTSSSFFGSSYCYYDARRFWTGQTRAIDPRSTCWYYYYDDARRMWTGRTRTRARSLGTSGRRETCVSGRLNLKTPDMKVWDIINRALPRGPSPLVPRWQSTRARPIFIHIFMARIEKEFISRAGFKTSFWSNFQSGFNPARDKIS